jgi:hypothetical protein
MKLSEAINSLSKLSYIYIQTNKGVNHDADGKYDVNNC